MDYLAQYKLWMDSSALTVEEKNEIASLSEKEIEDRFYTGLSFGTAGLRGILGVGLNRMNRFVVGVATQALATLVKQSGGSDMGVAIAYDCRHKSDTFARQAAEILAGNGIKVYIYESLRPTPTVSFAIRHYGCKAGINVTASHNPKEYNGYKVYWEDGAQLPPDEADAVAKDMNALDIFSGSTSIPFDQGVKTGLITIMGDETDQLFLKAAQAMSINTDCVAAVADQMKIVYTPFHGAGHRMVPEILKRIGYKHILCVPEQMVIDGNFPTVKSPNPEDKEGFALAIALAKENNVDLIIGTDPDADRVGVVVRAKNGDYITLTGNQTGILLSEYIIQAKKEMGTLPNNAAILKTIVTSEMVRKICEENGVACFETFTGFKFLAEKIKSFEDSGSHQYIFAFEESYGYLAGDFARDKDAVTASMLIAEMAAYYKGKDMTLYDALEMVYEKYGRFEEKTISIVMPGVDGLAKMRALMHNLRETPLTAVGGTRVSKIRYYLDGTLLDMEAGTQSTMDMKGSDVAYFELADGTSFIIRPSGTEPKVKVYILASGKTQEEVNQKVANYLAAAKEIVK